MRRGKDALIGTAGRHGEFDPADADRDEGADLEQLAADGAAGGVGEIGRLQGVGNAYMTGQTIAVNGGALFS